MMDVIKIGEAGYLQAIFGDGLSFGKTSGMDFEDFFDECLGESINPTGVLESCQFRTGQLSKQTRGHDGALKMVQTWWDIKAPRYFWVEMDTYGVGKSQRSESTMHTIKRRPLTGDDFEFPLDTYELTYINELIEFNAPLDKIKNALPEGFLQRRIVNLNYMGLKNIILQRQNHKLKVWHTFVDAVLDQVDHPELLPKLKTEKGGE